ncbi:MAG: ABC transporter ATP-binding protein/permease [Peptococcaceae bacterium]|jgi:ATP-binding cassette subfamily B protein|nr:ABC transporter ATP-binding protein/permease [Peptococcaceae bacterium]
MLKIIKLLKPGEWRQVLVIFLFSVTQVWLDLRFPDYLVEITRLVQTPGSPISSIWVAGAFMLLCAFASLTCVICNSFLASRTSAALAARLRGLLFAKVESFSMEEVGRFSTSSLITRSTNDVTQVQTFFMAGLQMMLRIPILAIGGIAKIAGKGTAWSLSTAAALGFCLLVVTIVMSVVLPLFSKMQSLVDNLNLAVRESLTGRFVMRAYNAQSYQTGKFSRANDAFTYTDQTSNRTMAAMGPTMSIANNGLVLVIYLIGASMITNAGPSDALLPFSNMMAMTAYASQVMACIKFITEVLPRWPRASVAAGRINEVLDTTPTMRNGSLTDGVAGAKGEVAFQNVSFKYPGAANYVLEDVSFTAKQGETVAFIGSTGSGKSTLVNLILRFYETSAGQVLVDGVDVRNYDRKALNRKIGYVPQKAVLFRGTVASNIAYGDNGKGGYSDRDIQIAAEIAQSKEFIANLEGGYDAAVSQGGGTFSGGQKQRLSIARAICRDPEILIFDDAFSALDYKTDRDLRGALKENADGITRLVVAQRIGAIMDADRIIVLDEGKVAGQGRHSELLQTCRVYREIAMSQLSEEELMPKGVIAS